jgi:putative ABC transport system permease protein
MYIEGRPAPRPGETVPTVQAVTPRFFETLRLPMLAGRAISAADDRERPLVAILSKTLVKQYFAGEDPIGRRIRLSNADARWLTVVGVAGDTTDWFNDQPEPHAYVSFAQWPSADAKLYIRTPGDPLLAIRPAQAMVKSLDPALALFDVKSEEQWLEEQTSGVRSAASSMTNYALIGLFLAATGIYAVIAYSVVRRTHEIGIRMALGADRATVLRMTLSEALRIGAIGLGIGLPVAYAMIRAMSSALFGVVQIDPATFAALTLALAFCAVAAGFVPAWRASRLDPVVALRNE